MSQLLTQLASGPHHDCPLLQRALYPAIAEARREPLRRRFAPSLSEKQRSTVGDLVSILLALHTHVGLTVLRGRGEIVESESGTLIRVRMSRNSPKIGCPSGKPGGGWDMVSAQPISESKLRNVVFLTRRTLDSSMLPHSHEASDCATAIQYLPIGATLTSRHLPA